MIEKQYQDTLTYLYEMLPMFQKDGNKAMKKGLENIQELCWAMGSPQWKFRSIHVGGTNGKGSVSSMLSSILMEAGYKVGIYTSPHLVNFTERIRINGKEIRKRDVVEFVDCYRRAIEKIQPSFFELTAAMAFEYFAEKEVDIAIIEVGLGGRLDSTNIIRPELSVITNISYDHMDILGDSLEAIAGEKAGIIKPYTPVVLGENHPETRSVFVETATELDAPFVFAEDRFKITPLEKQGLTQLVHSEDLLAEEEEKFDLGLMGDYQLQNLRTVLTAVEMLREDVWEITTEEISRGLKLVGKNSGFRGRMEQISQHPQIWCDTGHNEMGVKMAIGQILAMEYDRLHIVWGMVKDKNHNKMLGHLPKDANYYFVKPDVPRGLPAHTLQIIAEGLGMEGEVFDSVLEAVQIAIGKSELSKDLIFVGGSTFVVADLLKDWMVQLRD
ncbi:MAG: bifunctional folylpolyglutamate synthase/dihydrofolate synthase [Bacteroidia bacterium]|nr:bifunctional folylpolyglutamate synthase/dihydrofolate synthase [Bacteroidia bacterium]